MTTAMHVKSEDHAHDVPQLIYGTSENFKAWASIGSGLLTLFAIIGVAVHAEHRATSVESTAAQAVARCDVVDRKSDELSHKIDQINEKVGMGEGDRRVLQSQMTTALKQLDTIEAKLDRPQLRRPDLENPR